MNFTDLFKLSTRMFKTRPLRTFLTILGVSVGIGTVLFLVSLGYGLQNAILHKITTAESLLSLEVTPGNSDLINLTQEDADEISKIEGVAEVSPVVNLSAQMSIEEFNSDGLIYAVDPLFFRLSGLTANYGQTIKSADKYEAIISSAGVQLFNLAPEEIIGKELSLALLLSKMSEDGFEEIEVVKRDDIYKIVGVVEDQNVSYVFINRNTISDLQIKEYSQLKIKVSNDKQIDSIRTQIIEKGFLVSALSDTIDQANKIFKIIQIVLALFGLVALTVSAIGMFNTMTISLLERINEIGIMRAIGVTRKDIRKLFLLESVIMGLAGGIGGIIVGYLVGQATNLGVNVLAKTFGGQSLNFFYCPLWFIFFIIIFSTLIGFVTGIYPSIKASKLNPLTALRYK